MSKDGMVGKKKLSRGKEPMTSAGEEYHSVEQYISTQSLLWLFDRNVKPVLSGENVNDFRKVVAHPLPGGRHRSKSEMDRLGLHFKTDSEALLLFEHMMKFRRSVNILLPRELSEKCSTRERVITFKANMTLREYLEKNKHRIFFNEDPKQFSPFFIDLMKGIGKGVNVVHSEGFYINDLSLDTIFVYDDGEIDKEVTPMILVTNIVQKTDEGVYFDLRQILEILKFSIEIGSTEPLPDGHEILDLLQKMENNILKSAKSILLHPGLWAPLQKTDYLLEFFNWYKDNHDIKQSLHQYVESHLLPSKKERDGKGNKVADYLNELRNLTHHINRKYKDFNAKKDPASIYICTQRCLERCPGLLVNLVEYGERLGLEHMVWET